MTYEPRTPDDPPIGESTVPPSPPSPASAPTPSAASAAPAPTTDTSPTTPYEPADSLPATRVGHVAADGTTSSLPPARGRSSTRWILALLGVLIVAAGTALIVSLAGGRPSQSVALGYMPATTYTYAEFRFDLPGDQRQKLAGFLANFPGFKDQTQVDVKLTDVLDRIVRAASKDKQTWSADIKPWFGGQVAVGMGLPPAGSMLGGGMTQGMGATGLESGLFAVSITDRAKASAWIAALDTTHIRRGTHGNADYFDTADRPEMFAVAVTDKLILAGSAANVKAAVDSNGNTAFAQDAEVKAALATVDKDYVMLSVVRTKAYLTEAVKAAASIQPGMLEGTQMDETLLAMLPAWQIQTARFESDALVASSTGGAYQIGYETTNRASGLVGHVPAKTIVYLDYHDVGPALKALSEKFRALPEAKPAFEQIDRALSLLGGFDAAFGWWGDTAVVVSSLADGTIGGGLVIKPRDAAAADRLLTVLNGSLAFAGGSAGVVTRTEDHNGTKVTIADLSGANGMNPAGLPVGYKAEVAWATNADITVIGYGATFVKEVLDAGPGASLGDDARFKGLLNRVGAENISLAFVDVAGIRGLIEPLLTLALPAEQMQAYNTEIKPYLEHLDAMIGANRKDGALDRGSSLITVR